MITTPVAAGEVRRQMELSLGIREPARRRRPRRRGAVRVTAAVALRRLADRLEPAPC
ncbi:MAG TPA: hypothetical protein VE753_05045 [Gaiellaceae bacterium]|jgi:hypothetical protein|nr:hypothetical protein [Gaiellaceae bacterium]